MGDSRPEGLTELLLKAVVESHSMVVITDPACSVQYVNDLFCRVTGFAREEILGRHVRVMKSGLMDRDFYAGLWEQLQATGQWHGEFHNRRKNGEIYIEDAVISVSRNSHGELDHYLKVADDVTAQRLLEAELEASQQRYERVVRAMHGFMFTVLLENGRAMKTLYYPGTQEVTGYTPDDYWTNPGLWFNMIVEEDRPMVTKQIDCVQMEKKQHSVEHRIRHKNGTVRWVRNISVPTLDHNQQLVSYDGLITDITELKEAEAHRDRLLNELRLAAVRDPLTGLYSRRMFDDEVHRAWQISERSGQPLGIIMMDVDHFKAFNDTYGHLVGDQILVEAARLAVATVRGGDVVCRYGGDEMVIILPMTGIEETQSVGTRMLEEFRRHVFCRNTHDLHATVSIGAAAGRGRTLPVSEILNQADQGLYHAKHMGRNMLCFFDPDSEAPFVTVGNDAKCVAVVQPVTECRSRGVVLLVDDEAAGRESICQLLEKEHYTVLVAADIEQAVQVTRRDPGRVDVVLADERLACGQGADIMRALRTDDDTIVGVVMSEAATRGRSPDSILGGVVSFIDKPVSPVQLLPALDRAILERRIRQENRRCRQTNGDMVAERTAALTRMIGNAKQSYLSTVALLATILEVYDRKAADHCKRVEEMVAIIAHELQMAGEEAEMLDHAALLHDIGKMGIPDAILRKRGPLTAEEWKIMKLHAQIGHDILRCCTPLAPAAGMILEHHERFDGSGYPCGLRAKQICKGARIIALADTYDTIRTEQPYARARGEGDALAEIVRCRGVLFDPDVVDGFLRCQTSVESCVSGEA